MITASILVRGGEGLGLDVVERLRNREEGALIEVMNEYGNQLLRLAVLLVKDHLVAEEVVQDVFVTAFQKIEQLKDGNKLKSWLVMITMNECRKRMRKWSWKNITLHKDPDIEKNLIDLNDKQPEDSFILSWRDAQLHKQIQNLPYKYREVITLFYFQELSIKEIVELINEKENTVKTRLSRGRDLLKNHIERGGDNIAK